jgi:hypothetical protein
MNPYTVVGKVTEEKMKLFKRKQSAAETAALTARLLLIAEGMRRSGKSLEEIQIFLAQTVAVTTDLSSHDAATLVNDTLDVFFKSVPMTGSLPESTTAAAVPAAAGQKDAETKTIAGQMYVEVTPETHRYSVEAPPWKKKDPVTASGPVGSLNVVLPEKEFHTKCTSDT